MATKYSKEQLERHLSYEILMLNVTYSFIMISKVSSKPRGWKIVKR